MSITIALAGNPNSGKTTLFNALTGANQYVGNWPGVTVEKKEARFLMNGEEALLVDLPGAYSLSTYSIEEKITRSFIAEQRPDVVLNIVDATNFERNLYLTLQLMELERPMVMALNLMDEFEKNGGQIDCARLTKALGIPVVPISAKKKQGFNALFAAIYRQARDRFSPDAYRLYDAKTRKAVAEISASLGGSADAKTAKWLSLKALEGDATMPANLPDKQREKISRIVAEYIKRPEADGMTRVGGCRYSAIELIMRDGLYLRKGGRGEDLTDRIDRIVTNKYLAFPLFLSVMGLMFGLTFGPVGQFLCGLSEAFMSDVVGAGLFVFLKKGGAPFWLQSLMLDGVVAGVGGVLTFLPQILLIFLCLTILEDSGYMARAAFIIDRLFSKLGLSGRSFIPMLIGFGCTTTAVVAARGVASERDRRMTIMLTPYMSCGAKLPVYGLIAAALFQEHRALCVFSLYLLGMLTMVILGLILRKTAFREGDTSFVMELPPYRMPTFFNVARRLWDRAKDFLSRAGTLIFLMSILIWLLKSFTPSFRFTTLSEASIFGEIGRHIAPVFQPLGFGDWQKVVALMAGLVAKEAIVSTMQVLYGAADSTQLANAVARQFTGLAAYSYLVFILLYPACIAAMASISREMGSKKYTLMTIGLQLVIAYIAAFIVFNVGRLLM